MPHEDPVLTEAGVARNAKLMTDIVQVRVAVFLRHGVAEFVP